MSAKPVVHMIALADIDVRDRLRPADQASVGALARDIDRRGLRVPIEVTGQLRGDKKYRLVSGLHRITAFQSLGREDIPAFIVSGNLLELRRDELLENLTRNELSKLERAQFLAELKRVHLEIHPEAAHGGDRRSGEFQERNFPSWSEAAVSRTGWTEATLKKAVAIGERLDAGVADRLRATAIAENQKELETLSRFSPSIQERIAGLLVSGDARSVTGAHRLLSGAPGEGDGEDGPEEKALKKLLDAWNRAPGKVRARFLRQLCDDGVLEPPGRVGGYRIATDAEDDD